jgi:3'-phosphoadenosine 5'-phosphosulfate synthase
LAVIEGPEFYENRKEEIATRVFGTSSHKHPKIDRIWKQGDYLLSGANMRFLKKIEFNDGMDQYRKTPEEIYAECKSKGADAIYAF